MSKSEFSPSPRLTPMERRRCPHCTSHLRGGIGPGHIGFELRLLECPKCDSVQNEVVASDPMKSAYVGWLAGELRTPN